MMVLMSICGCLFLFENVTCRTIFTDGLHDDLGLELWIEIIVFGFLTAFSFFVWFRFEGTLDIHSIYTLRREGFYWLTILFTFALGTAVGDGISEGSGIAFGPILGLFAGWIALIAIVWIILRYTGHSPKGSSVEIFLFWFAYVMTRPFGASCGDLLSSSKAEGGVNLGTGVTSAIFSGIIVVSVIFLIVTGHDLEVLKADPLAETRGL
eukprot:c10110_g3_i1.p1 GENE.c10110_g3_i1~~c10110_g3_i1.p1  ORF type:complete len:209 (+),score=28.19 c10110_g3_i1:125-751(+)